MSTFWGKIVKMPMVNEQCCPWSVPVFFYLPDYPIDQNCMSHGHRVCGLGGVAEAAAVDVYLPEQDAEEEVLQEDSTESDSAEFDI